MSSTDSQPPHPHPNLAADFAAWQETGDPYAASALINAFGGLAIDGAGRYAPGLRESSGAIDISDLVLVGFISMLNTATGYDPATGVRFPAASYKGVRGSQYREFYRHGLATYITTNAHPTLRFILRCVDQAELEGTRLTDAQIEDARLADGSIDPLAYTSEGEVPPYNTLVAIWRSQSLEIIQADEEEAQTDPYTGYRLDDEGRTWEYADIISSDEIAGPEPDHADIVATKEDVRILLSRVFQEPELADDYSNLGDIFEVRLQGEAVMLYFGLGGHARHTTAEITEALDLESYIALRYPRASEQSKQRRLLKGEEARRLLHKGLKRIRDFVACNEIPASDFYLD